MLTVREALALPVFAEARLVAGQQGLDRAINWVHIVDIPDARYEWDRQGVLLLTAGYGLRDHLDRQAMLVPQLVERGFAGIVLATGYYFDRAPDIIRLKGDALNFPVIETPPHLLFIEVTEAILGRIVNRQYALLRQSIGIHERLTELVLQGAGLDVLAETLAALLQRSITIESAAFHVLASARRGPVDAAREQSVAAGRTTPELARHLLDMGVFAQLLAEKRPLQLAPLPQLGMELARIVAPVIVDQAIVAYIWIIAEERPLTQLDELAISHAATVAALILFKEQAVQQARDEQQGELIDRLLSGEVDAHALAAKAQQLQFRLDRPQQVVLLQQTTSRGPGVADELMESVARWLRGEPKRPLVALRRSQLILLLESDRPADGRALAARLVTDLLHPGQQLLAGVGDPARPLLEAPGGIRRSYDEAREALQVGRLLGQAHGVACFGDLGLLHWLYHLPPGRWDGNAYLGQIRALAAYDARRGTDLVGTLQAYLERGAVLVETAQALFIHRNTLLHRLERIQQVCGVDLRDPLCRLNLHVAVLGYRLQGG